jgi:hypothetical protein
VLICHGDLSTRRRHLKVNAGSRQQDGDRRVIGKTRTAAAARPTSWSQTATHQKILKELGWRLLNEIDVLPAT